MKTKIKNLRSLDTPSNLVSSARREYLAGLLYRWRQKLGVYSMFAAVPAMLVSTGRAQDADRQSDGARENTSGLQDSLNRTDRMPARMKRSNYSPPPQQAKENSFVDELLGGTDNCPGLMIPNGSYTSTNPFNNIGDTTGANNSVNFLCGYYYCYYGTNVSGPDVVYSFKLSSRGASPEIRVTPTSSNYRPVIYVLDGSNSGGCPDGVGSYVWNALAYAESPDVGQPVTLNSAAINNLPLNVPLHLFIDSGQSANSGAYVLRIQDIAVPSGPKPTADFDGDNRTDISVYRPSAGEWWYSKSSDGVVRSGQFGTSTDIPTPGDFTGDGKTDIAFWRPSDGNWYILRSEDGSYFSFPFGTDGDIPMPADFDADGKTDAAIFRPSNGLWFIPQSGGGGTLIGQFGANGDQPIAADYDGDGKADVGVIRRNLGNMEWWIQRSTAGLFTEIFGAATDKAVPGDYTGDGKTDVAVWRPSDGQWFVLRSEDLSYFAFPFGQNGDVPAPGDYDGDGKTDATVFRPSTATWWVNRSGGGGAISGGFGTATDQPVPSVFVR